MKRFWDWVTMLTWYTFAAYLFTVIAAVLERIGEL